MGTLSLERDELSRLVTALGGRAETAGDGLAVTLGANRFELRDAALSFSVNLHGLAFSVDRMEFNEQGLKATFQVRKA
jgi:hypothetical protein